jgi:hypothetical protein
VSEKRAEEQQRSGVEEKNNFTSPLLRFPSAPLLAFLFSRLWVAIFVYAGHAQHAYLSPIIGGWEGVKNWWLNPWTAFDSQLFIGIAQHGYDAKSAAFFPLYPLLLKLAGSNSIAMAAWGIFISSAAFLGALLIFYRLTEREYSQRTAIVATWLLAFFPTTVYFSAVYTDALFLLFFVAAFWCLRKQQWVWVAVWALLASLTRNLGPLLFLALFIEWWQARKSESDKPPPWTILAVCAPLLGLLAAQGFIALQVGDALRGVTSQSEYFRAPTWPWLPIWRDILALFQGYGLALWLHLSATIAAFVLVARHRKTIRLSYATMILGLMLMHLTLGHTIVPYTLPSARYLSTMFPFVQLLALEVEPLTHPKLRLFLFAFLWLFVTALTSFLFGQKSFLG